MLPIQQASNAEFKQEYGCLLRRMMPWRGEVDACPWGSAWAIVEPGTQTTPHAHDEDEIFIILAGSGVIHIDGVAREVSRGDVIRLPRNSMHTLANPFGNERLEFITIYWGGEEMYTVPPVEAPRGAEPVPADRGAAAK